MNSKKGKLYTFTTTQTGHRNAARNTQRQPKINRQTNIGWLHTAVSLFRVKTVQQRRVCTISATDHIGHNHIGHTKRPYQPKWITRELKNSTAVNIFLS